MPNDNDENLPHPNQMTTSDQISINWISQKLGEIAKHRCADAMHIFGPIIQPLDDTFRLAIERTNTHRNHLLAIVDTPGGSVEVTERIAETMRHHYQEISFLVPSKAMSAGTILVMSGDAIIMDYHSRLGPVDPQIVHEGKTTPISALSYLEPYKDLLKKSQERDLTTAELVLLQQMNIADLRQYELAADLSVSLIRQWLQTYKFKDWDNHSSTHEPVTPEEKEQRADEIATAL